jgi:hypothetical protein
MVGKAEEGGSMPRVLDFIETCKMERDRCGGDRKTGSLLGALINVAQQRTTEWTAGLE